MAFCRVRAMGCCPTTWSKAVERYRPKVVCIEYNPTIPYRSPYFTPRDPAYRHGSSVLAFEELGAKKGYRKRKGEAQS